MIPNIWSAFKAVVSHRFLMHHNTFPCYSWLLLVASVQTSVADLQDTIFSSELLFFRRYGTKFFKSPMSFYFALNVVLFKVWVVWELRQVGYMTREASNYFETLWVNWYSVILNRDLYEPRHDKINIMGLRPVWTGSMLFAINLSTCYRVCGSTLLVRKILMIMYITLVFIFKATWIWITDSILHSQQDIFVETFKIQSCQICMAEWLTRRTGNLRILVELVQTLPLFPWTRNLTLIP
jgi:hypothetical protein